MEKKDSSPSSTSDTAYTVYARDAYWIYQIRTFARSRNSFVRVGGVRFESGIKRSFLVYFSVSAR